MVKVDLGAPERKLIIDLLNQYLDWILAVTGLYGQYMTFVRKVWWSPWYGLIMQIGWIYYAIIRNDFGLITLCGGSSTIMMIAILNDRRLALKRMRPENAEKNQVLKETLHLDKVGGGE